VRLGLVEGLTFSAVVNVGITGVWKVRGWGDAKSRFWGLCFFGGDGMA
jgi:hypothetical protein